MTYRCRIEGTGTTRVRFNTASEVLRFARRMRDAGYRVTLTLV